MPCIFIRAGVAQPLVLIVTIPNIKFFLFTIIHVIKFLLPFSLQRFEGGFLYLLINIINDHTSFNHWVMWQMTKRLVRVNGRSVSVGQYLVGRWVGAALRPECCWPNPPVTQEVTAPSQKTSERRVRPSFRPCSGSEGCPTFPVIHFNIAP